MNNEYQIEKDYVKRYYFAEQWPWSDKNDDISNALFYFVQGGLSGLITGQDRYIIWYLIERYGSFPFSQTTILQKEIRTKLNPMSLGVINNLKRLEILEVIKPNYWEGKVEFTDYFLRRLEVFKEYKNENMDMYIKKLFELEFENR